MHHIALRLALILSLLGTLFISGNLAAQKRPIADVLYEEITTNGIESAVAKYDILKTSRGDYYDFSEGQLNNLGYRLLKEGLSAEAVEIFKLNVKVFPNSPNTYDSLGEAYMQTGVPSLAIANYENVLNSLENANLSEEQKQFLQQNAEAKLAILRNPNTVESTYLREFMLSESDAPFGKLHPDAPPETEQWGQLAGTWDCTQFALVNGQWFSGWKATWAWRYILDGFAVQDVWHQAREQLPPPIAQLPRDFVGTNIRIYDREQQKWQITWFNNGQMAGGTSSPVRYFEAEFIDDSIVMTPVDQPPDSPKSRIVFHNISDDSFDWKSETLDEDGKTWTETFRIQGKRVR